MKKEKKTDQVTVRLTPDQLSRLAELEKIDPKDLKTSHVIRAALRHYFACEDSRLPNGDLLNPPKEVPAKPSVPRAKTSLGKSATPPNAASLSPRSAQGGSSAA